MPRKMALWALVLACSGTNKSGIGPLRPIPAETSE